MFHFVYHTIIKANTDGSIRHYIGKHSTSNLNDGYVGSGKIIKRILNKEKKNPGTYEISCSRSKFFESSDEAYFFEELAIGEARDKFGSSLINISDGGVAPILRGENHPMYGRKHSPNTIEIFKSINKGKNNPMYGRTSGMKGRKQSEDAKRKISEANIGKRMPPKSKEAMEKFKASRAWYKPTSETVEKYTNSIRKSKGGAHWEFYDELKKLWNDTGMLGRGYFRKLAVEKGYPDCCYKRMIVNFQKDMGLIRAPFFI
ncbi:NUMOD3 domain-containing DNA-binding protein [Enterobacter hormaechei]